MSFALVLGVLLVRNAFLFNTPEYEDADMGANSILIEQARRFTLLVGNYSREGFNHPGPAFLYVQSWGESLFYDVLHVVPTPWNGQLIAVYALDALFAASVVAVAYGWTRSARGAAATLAVVLLFGALHPAVFSSNWMPYVYVPAYFAFLASIASVAGGRTQDAWLAALTGWFLIHGQACFLLFVPVLAVAAVAGVLWSRWREKTETQARGRVRALFAPPRPRVWIPVAVISAVFALPMIVELALHWPGNFAKYIDYTQSSSAGGHSLSVIAHYVLWFWWPGAHPWAAPILLVAVAVLLVWRLPDGPVRRLCVSLLAIDGVSTAVFAVYVVGAVDEINQQYIGYFYWSAPMLAILVIALSVTELLASAPSGRRALLRGGVAGTLVAALAAAAAFAAFAVAPQTRDSTAHTDPNNPTGTGTFTDPSLPAGVAKLASVAAGRPVLLSFAHNAWPEITGILVQAERTGVTACVTDPNWAFMMTSQFICTSSQLAVGHRFYVYVPGTVPHGVPVIYRLRRGIVTAGAK